MCLFSVYLEAAPKDLQPGGVGLIHLGDVQTRTEYSTAGGQHNRLNSSSSNCLHSSQLLPVHCKNPTEPDLGLLLCVGDGLGKLLDELGVEGVDRRLVHADGGDALVVGGHGDVRETGGGGGEPPGGLHSNIPGDDPLLDANTWHIAPNKRLDGAAAILDNSVLKISYSLY